jgi:hypothetical protein
MYSPGDGESKVWSHRDRAALRVFIVAQLPRR